MQIVLIHNPKAGTGRHSKKELIAALASLGHRVLYQSSKKRGWKKALKKSSDLVIAAGGDGTVAKVAWRIMDTGVPLSILPLGTANNLARSLGFTARPEEILTCLRSGKSRACDVGMARGPYGKRYFVEAAGGGLLADFVRVDTRKGKKEATSDQKMTREVFLLRKISAGYPPRQWTVSIDGEDISDRYLLWEAMNVRSAGPALDLAPRAESNDGRLDFVGVREQERQLFLEHLNARLAGKKNGFALPVRKFRKLEITSRAATLHIDGKPWPKKKQDLKRSTMIEITVRPAALMIWEPVFRSL